MDYSLIQTISDVFFYMEKSYSERTALRWIDDNKKTQQKKYNELCRDIRRGISYLHTIVNSDKEEHIAILASNGYDYVVMMYACLVSDTVVVPLNLQKNAEEILNELSDSDTHIVLHDGEFVARETSFEGQFIGKLLSIGDYKKHLEYKQSIKSSQTKLASIFYTSGTTAKSKGVMLHQKSLIASSAFCIEENNYFRHLNCVSKSYQINSYIVLPFYHIIGFGSLLSVFIDGGIANVTVNPKHFLRDIKMLPSDVACFTPIYLDMINKIINRTNKDFLGGLNVILTGGAPISANILKKLVRHGIVVLQSYGLTEVFAAVTFNSSQDINKLSSIGKCIRNHLLNDRIKIIDSELCIAGDSLMIGYYNDCEGTSAIIDTNGWLHTGDLAQEDEDGYLYITGRKKNLIILSNGENVNPEELEEKLYNDTDIKEVIVKEKNGVIVAEIYCEPIKKQSIEEYVAKYNKTVSRYKNINKIEFRYAPFERTSTGKIKR